MRKLLMITLLAMVGCTANERARTLGGTLTVKLAPRRKLVNVTWKETSLWVLTKPMNSNDSAESYEFKEESNYGIQEGKVVIVESK